MKCQALKIHIFPSGSSVKKKLQTNYSFKSLQMRMHRHVLIYEKAPVAAAATVLIHLYSQFIIFMELFYKYTT